MSKIEKSKVEDVPSWSPLTSNHEYEYNYYDDADGAEDETDPFSDDYSNEEEEMMEGYIRPENIVKTPVFKPVPSNRPIFDYKELDKILKDQSYKQQKKKKMSYKKRQSEPKKTSYSYSYSLASSGPSANEKAASGGGWLARNSGNVKFSKPSSFSHHHKKQNHNHNYGRTSTTTRRTTTRRYTSPKKKKLMKNSPSKVIGIKRRKTEEEEEGKCISFFTPNICLQMDKYPRKRIQNEMASDWKTLKKMYTEAYGSFSLVEGVSRDLEKLYSDGPVTLDEGPVCKSKVIYARPKMAKNLSGKWKTIINLDDFTQTVRMEKCSGSPEDRCNLANTNDVRTSCLQVHAIQRLLTYDEEKGFKMDVFKMPSTCKCYIFKDQVFASSHQVVPPTLAPTPTGQYFQSSEAFLTPILEYWPKDQPSGGGHEFPWAQIGLLPFFPLNVPPSTDVSSAIATSSEEDPLKTSASSAEDLLALPSVNSIFYAIDTNQAPALAAPLPHPATSNRNMRQTTPEKLMNYLFVKLKSLRRKLSAKARFGRRRKTIFS